MTSNYTPPNLVTPTPNGNAGDGSLKGELTVQSTAASPATNTTLLAVDSSGDALLSVDSGNDLIIAKSNKWSSIQIINSTWEFTTTGDTNWQAQFNIYKGISVVGLGVPPIVGLDNRTGLTATDSSAKTLYTTTAASQVYRVTARVFGKSGTISSAVYTIGWTEGGTAMTETVSISAVSTMDSAVFLLQPDNGKAITVQLTTLSGTSPVVDVAATLEQMA